MKFASDHRAALHDILTWRRDVRSFRSDAIDPAILQRIKATMDFAPSVGNARPWRVLQVENRSTRDAVIANFETANAAAAAGYKDAQRTAYENLKLAGLRCAPIHLAVFTALDPQEGSGLGRQTMPQTLTYSTVCAIHTLWLAARAENIGLGWVSIIDPDALHATLEAPQNWSLTAYLCLGHASENADSPLLHRNNWQQNTATDWRIV